MNVPRAGRTFTLLTGLAIVGAIPGCWGECPEPIPVESGDYIIVGLADGRPLPGDQWLLDRVVGAVLRVDRDAEEATIRYTVGGTTYEVRYTLE